MTTIQGYSARLRRLPHLALALLLSAATPAGAEAPVFRSVESVAGDTAWEGGILVAAPLEVPAGVTLTVRPGCEVRFREGAALTVSGRLLAQGSAEHPVTFSSEGGAAWAGITLSGEGEPSHLSDCRILAAAAVTVTSGKHAIERCEIAGGTAGVVADGVEARPILKGNRLHDLAGGGVRCLGKAAPLVEGNTIERCGPYGVHASQGSGPLIVRNTISACTNGIELIQTAPFLRDNLVRGCERGIALQSAGGGKPVQGNTVEDCKVGIAAQQFSSPEISGNRIARNGEGINCTLGSRPLIRGNDVRENETGISCNQLSTPTIEANAIERNRRGIFLNLSSYAIIRANNIFGNEVQMELGNMSLDWERRVGRKPMRGLQQQAAIRAGQGVAAPAPSAAPSGPDGLEFAGGAVEATGNWWGEATTREMELKGPDADITSLRDWHDVPTLTYEGYEGEYVQDRIAYAPWAKERIAGAGIVSEAAPAPGSQP